MKTRLISRILAGLGARSLLCSLASAEVLKIVVNDTIQPITAEYISRALDEARRRNDQAILIEINTPGGLLESKRISDMADLYYIWTAAHNPASPLGTIASAHAASSMRSFRIHELAKYIDWWQDLVIHEGPIFDGGYLTIQDKPGYGIELNPDVAKAHLAPGETWWG